MKERMGKKDLEAQRLPDQAAKHGFLLLGLHIVLFWLATRGEERWLAVHGTAMLAYWLCILRLDRIAFRLRSREMAKTMLFYWGLLSVWMADWLVHGDAWIYSSGDVLKLLLSFAVLPFAPLFSHAYTRGWRWEWSSGAAQVCNVALLLICVLHAAYYVWLFRGGRTETSTSDTGV